MKADELMKNITDDGPIYDKLVKELRKVFGREKFLKF